MSSSVRAIRRLLALVCPDIVMSHIVDQALADLDEDLVTTTGRRRQIWLVASGATALVAALVTSLFRVPAYWRHAPWWPARGLWVESLTWAVPLILFAAIRYEWAIGEKAVRPDGLWLLALAAPAALPAAAGAFALIAGSRRGGSSVALVAAVAALMSLGFAFGVPALYALASGRPDVPLQASGSTHWRAFLARRYTEQAELAFQSKLAMVALCITLPVATMGVSKLLRMKRAVLPTLAFALVAVEMTMRLSWFRGAPTPMTTLTQVSLDLWMPNALLVVIALVTPLVRRSNAVADAQAASHAS